MVQVFLSSVHTCEVCFSDKPGSQCLSLDECRHVFCCECLRANCELIIAEGCVDNLKCMMPDCTAQLHPTQVFITVLVVAMDCIVFVRVSFSVRKITHGTNVFLDNCTNPIEFQGHKLKVKVTGSRIFRHCEIGQKKRVDTITREPVHLA